MPDLRRDINTIQYSQDDEGIRVLQLLSDTDYPAQHSDITSRRQEGTSEWFLTTPAFKT